MREGISGNGQLWKDGTYICDAHYEIDAEQGAPDRAFTLTDGIVTVAKAGAHDREVRALLEPFDSLELVLAEPLADGRERLPIRIESYEGHRPDDRYQIRVRD